MKSLVGCFFIFLILVAVAGTGTAQENLKPDEMELVRKFERQRIEAIDKVVGSVIAIYGEQRQGGGSGVIIDPSGIGLTNHHVITGAGVQGWGGLADGNLYRWDLIGTDPGGDVAIIQMKGKDVWPYTPLADSDQVQVGDWSLAMGNPFVLTEDQVPTVTLGIVSGVKRYQPGAGSNQLVYGNCIQTDSSINPGNSGGPLFNLAGKVIGINGRGSFKERGRVNVGLGYAISSNQIKNFIPDLLATKLVEHGTLDASFEDRGGKVVCSQVYEDSKIYKLGLRPGDQLIEFEGVEIETANQFTNLICTLPEDWPVQLVTNSVKGGQKTYHTRLYGLPYAKPQQQDIPQDDKERTPEEKEKIARMQDMIDLLSAPPGTVRSKEVNRIYADHVMRKLKSGVQEVGASVAWEVKDKILQGDTVIGAQQIRLNSDGTFAIDQEIGGESISLAWDGKECTRVSGDDTRTMSLVEMKLSEQAVQAIGILASNSIADLRFLGDLLLDGSDKADSRNAYRLRVDDEDEDSFYFWLSMQNRDATEEEVRWLKAAADKDCSGESGGVLFDDWGEESGLKIARSRRVVSGLEEKTQRVYQLQSVRKLDTKTKDSKP